jgi:CBS domain-containing protein
MSSSSWRRECIGGGPEEAAARIIGYRGAAGCRESGEVSTDGIVAVEDFHVRLHRTRRRLIPPHMRVRDVMTSGPTTVSPDTTSIDAIRILLAADFHTLPVVDAAGRPAGIIITQGDLIRRGGMPVRLGLLPLPIRHPVPEVEQERAIDRRRSGVGRVVREADGLGPVGPTTPSAHHNCASARLEKGLAVNREKSVRSIAGDQGETGPVQRPDSSVLSLSYSAVGNA